MDGYNDLYDDQFKVDDMSWSEADDHVEGFSRQEPSGYYEDSLRLAQQGVSAQLTCGNNNPYIQDNIADSQRHNPIRHPDIQMRSQQLDEASCDWTRTATECPTANGQRVRLVPRGQSCDGSVAPKLGCDAPDSNTNNLKSLADDNKSLVFLFIFIVLVVLCMHFWQNDDDINTSITKLFHSRSSRAVSENPSF